MPKRKIFSITKKDLDISFFRGSGAGGQHRNKSDTAVRIVHRESGVSVTSQEERSQHANIKTALNKLAKHPRFLHWCQTKISLEEMMHPSNIKTEYQNELGEWYDATDIV